MNPWKTNTVQSCFRENQRCSVLILLLWKIDFSALIRAESALYRDFQVLYNAESDLKQHWSAVIIPESKLISAQILWDLNPGKLFSEINSSDSTLYQKNL